MPTPTIHCSYSRLDAKSTFLNAAYLKFAEGFKSKKKSLLELWYYKENGLMVCSDSLWKNKPFFDEVKIMLTTSKITKKQAFLCKMTHSNWCICPWGVKKLTSWSLTSWSIETWPGEAQTLRTKESVYQCCSVLCSNNNHIYFELIL